MRSLRHTSHTPQDYIKRLQSTPLAQTLSRTLQDAYAATAPHLLKLAPLQDKARSYAQPGLQALSHAYQALSRQLAPLVTQLQQHSGSAVHQASASLGPYLHQVSARVSALVRWRTPE